VYWDNHVDKADIRLKYKDQKQMASLMDDLVFSDTGASRRHFIVQPISGKLRATMDHSKEIKLEAPKTLLDLEVETIELGLNRLQFLSLFDLIDYIGAYSKNFKVRLIPVLFGDALLTMMCSFSNIGRQKQWRQVPIRKHGGSMPFSVWKQLLETTRSIGPGNTWKTGK